MAEQKGYTGRILRVDLSSGQHKEVSTIEYANRFLGGRGISAKVYWDEVPSNISPFSPENRLCIMTGPLCGIQGIAASRWQVSAKSPLHNTFSYCNLGGTWGAEIKFAGYDGLIIEGKSEDLVYLIIDDRNIEIKNANFLKGMGAIETQKRLKKEYGKSVKVVSIGPAGENRVNFATLTADQDSSGSSGMGAVFGSKNLKAIAVRGSGKLMVAEPEKLSRLRKTINEIKFEWYSWPTMLPKEQIKKQICFGCINGCVRQSFTARSGNTGKYMCQSATFYEVRAKRYYGDVTETPFYANKLCDEYGLDTRIIETMIMWLSRSSQAGILTDKNMSMPISKLGSLEFVDTLIKKISFREGFGEILAQGILKAAEILGRGSERFIKDYMIGTGENEVYGPRQYITTGLFYAMEPRMPIQQLHEISIPAVMWAQREMGNIYEYNYFLSSDVFRLIGERFWGSEIAADFSTYQGKAMAAAKIQDRQYAKESLILCDFAWPIIFSPNTSNHVGDPSLESKLFSAITGRQLDEQELYKIGRRIFNLQRAIMVREGHQGRYSDRLEEFCYTAPLRADYGNPKCLVPGIGGKAFSRKGMVVDRDKFEKMKDEFYMIRGWDVNTGLQTKKELQSLDLGIVADALKKKGILSN